MIKTIRNLFGGDTESNTPDFKRLKDDVHATLIFVEELIGLAENITSEKLTLRCRDCAKKEHIKYSKDAVFIASQVQSQRHSSKISSHRPHDNRTSINDTSVDGHTKYNPASEKREQNRYARVTEETERNHENASDYVQDTLIKEGTGDEEITERTTTDREATNQLREKLEKAELEKSTIEEMFEAKKKELIELQDESSKRLAEEIDENEKLKLSREDLQRDLKNERSKYMDLKSTLDKNEEENMNMRKRLDGLKLKYDLEMKQSETEQKSLTSELSDIKTAKDRILEELRKSNAKNENLNRRIQNTEKTRMQERKDNERQKDSMNSKMDELKREISSHQKKIDSFAKQVEDLQSTCRSKNAEIESMNSRMTYLKREIDSKQREIDSHAKQIVELRMTCASMNEEIKSTEERNKDLSKQNSSKTECIRMLEEELKTKQNSFEREYRRFKSNIASLEDEILGLKKDLADWEERTKKKLAINFHTSLKQSLALPAQQHIERCLKERCQSDKVTLEVNRYKSPDTTPGPILVLCMNVSRLGTDVKEALKGTPGNFEVLVVVLHHKEVHALPSQASDRVLTGEEYKQLGAIVDAAFWTGKGMYDCELNKLATEKIYNFVSGFVSK